MRSNIPKLYLSHFLIGLIFWYGIEKLFMQSIGIDAVGVGIAAAILLGFNLIFDIPSGILADKWSRKGMLLVGATAMAICSIVLGISHGLSLFIVGYLFYGVYVVFTSGTYQAIMYDSLHEENESDQYSKVMGRAYALFLVGAGVANVLSGYISGSLGYQSVFFLSVIPCVINFFVIASLSEPKFHKAGQNEKIFKQIRQSVKAIASIRLLRSLAIIMSVLTIVELFKTEFGQLYMLRYVSTPQALGLLWAVFAFTWAIGSIVAHKFHARLDILVLAAVLPLVAMSFVDNWFSLVLFMIQATASAALLNQIETRIQDATPSSVRASVMSVLYSIGRAVSIPAVFVIGWLIRDYDAFWALRGVTVVAVVVLLYWFWASRKEPRTNEPIVTKEILFPETNK